MTKEMEVIVLSYSAFCMTVGLMNCRLVNWCFSIYLGRQQNSKNTARFQVSTLCWAVYNNDFDMLTRLVENGADLQAKVTFSTIYKMIKSKLIMIYNFRVYSYDLAPKLTQSVIFSGSIVHDKKSILMI